MSCLTHVPEITILIRIIRIGNTNALKRAGPTKVVLVMVVVAAVGPTAVRHHVIGRISRERRIDEICSCVARDENGVEGGVTKAIIFFSKRQFYRISEDSPKLKFTHIVVPTNQRD
jgi:hypothetical protein